MFEIKNLSKQYGGEFALNDVTMNIGKGMNFIVGASGSGKTTLLKILSGFESCDEGEALYCGRSINSFSPNEKSSLYNNAFGFVWQDFQLSEEATVIENILMPSYLKDNKAAASADKIIKQLKLEDIRDKKVSLLSGGQKQRVAIARELMKNPQVIFCDEPTSALDAENAKMIIDILRVLSKRRCVIVVTHDESLINGGDFVYELDKGELVSAPEVKAVKANLKELPASKLSVRDSFKIAFMNLKNRAGRFLVSVLSLFIAGTLLLTSVSGAITKSGEEEFKKLVETYGDSILDIGFIGNFTSAAGTDGSDEQQGSVSQDLNGLYEKYQNDERVEFIVMSQAFENIKITSGDKTYTVEKTGNTPVLTKLLSGSIPSGEEYSVVIPLKFAESMGLTPETAIGKNIEFSATIFQWINNTPIEKPVKINAVVCGVADNTVVYDYEGKSYSFTVDDSFFFNKSATEELRRQAGVTEKPNFTVRAKTPEDLISLRDELNKNGIVPLGRFELVEDIVKLNGQVSEQSGSAAVITGVLSVLLAAVIFAMTSVLRKREYSVYKTCGYNNAHLMLVTLAETALSAVSAALLTLILSPLSNMAAKAMFGADILSAEKLFIGILMVLGLSVVAFAAAIPGYTLSKPGEGAKS